MKTDYRERFIIVSNCGTEYIDVPIVMSPKSYIDDVVVFSRPTEAYSLTMKSMQLESA